MSFSRRAPRRSALILATAATLFGSMPGGSAPALERPAPKAVAQADGGGGTICKMGFSTSNVLMTPPDDSVDGNPAANVVTMTKPCAGPVFAVWSGEVGTQLAGGSISMWVRAKCIGTGGQPNPCTVGEVVNAAPGETNLAEGQEALQTHTMQFVFPKLKRGKWRFRAIPAGAAQAYVDYRTFRVDAYSAE